MILIGLTVIGVARAEPPAADVAAAWSGGPSQVYSFVDAGVALGGSDHASFGIRTSWSFLRYEIRGSGEPSTRVDSMGLSLAAGFRYAPDHNLSVGVATGAEVRRALGDDGTTWRDALQFGATVGLDAYWRPEPRVALSAVGSFSGANRYGYSELGARRQVIPLYRHHPPAALWLGVGATAQGNRDVRALAGGPAAEVVVAAWKMSFGVNAGFGVEYVGDLEPRPTARLGVVVYRSF